MTTERKSSGPRRSADVTALTFPAPPVVRDEPTSPAQDARRAARVVDVGPGYPPADFGAQREAGPAVSLPELPAMPAPMARRDLEGWRVRVRPLAGKLARLLREAHELRVALADELASAEAAGVPASTVSGWLADAGLPTTGPGA